MIASDQKGSTMNIDNRCACYGGGCAERGSDGRFVGVSRSTAPAPLPRKASAAFLAASAAHRKRAALIARVTAKAAPDRSLLRKIRVRASDIYQNPNLGKRDAWGQMPVAPRTRLSRERTALIAPGSTLAYASDNRRAR